MEQFVAVDGWFFLISVALGVLGSLTITVVGLARRSRAPQIIGAELPVIDASIDLGKMN
jgi:hypothetical protein